MSILIKDIDMPEACIYWDEAVEEHKYCPFLGDSGYCVLQGVDSVSKSYPKMYQDCLLIEVPAPHGRLIDADELFELYNDCDDEIWESYVIPIKIVGQNIKDAPTVIEAEEDK